jgi:hypothetical protein
LEADRSPIKDFLLKFVVSGMNGRQPISAKVRLYDINPSSQGGDFHRVADSSWDEATVTWNNAPAADAAVIGSLGAVVVNTWYEVDITSVVTQDGPISLRVTSSSTNGADYSSKEDAAGFAPQLVVTVSAGDPTPTPTPTPTPVATPQMDAVLVGAGDIASCIKTGDEATANLLDAIPGTVFTAGDNAYESGTDAELADCYGPSWGRHKARTRPAVGNHEYNTPGASGYFNYFGAAAGDPSKGYYSYDLGNWHIVVLNSICSSVPGGCASGSPQEQWLRSDLTANTRSCTLAYWHHSRYSSGISHGSQLQVRDLFKALYDFDADVVISAHDHNYERFAPQDADGNLDAAAGIRQFVAGTGGRSLSAFGAPIANSEVRDNNTDGVLKLSLHPTSYDWEFVPVAGKTFTDSGSQDCH